MVPHTSFGTILHAGASCPIGVTFTPSTTGTCTGTLTGTSKSLGGAISLTLAGNGVNPTCQPKLKWTLFGRFVGKVYTGTVNITLPDSSHAVSKLHLVRS